MTIPVKQDLACYKGQTYEQNFYFKHNSEPIDLTGCTAKAQVRPVPNSDTLTAEFVCTVDGTAGKVSLSLDSAVTAGFVPGSYAWDLQMTDTHDDVRYWIQGAFTVRGRVTK